jgi:hypothetical protein
MGTFRPSEQYVSGAGGYDLAMADMNGDGAREIVVSGGSTGVILPGLCSGVPPQSIGAVSPPGTISPTTPVLTVPVTLSRTTATPILGYSVRFHLTGLDLSGPGTTGISEGPFLSADNPLTSFQVIDNGGGSYTVDDVTLGVPCGSRGLAGTLFNVATGSSALTGPGRLTIDEIKVFDCSNSLLGFSIGPAASVAIDYTVPLSP